MKLLDIRKNQMRECKGWEGVWRKVSEFFNEENPEDVYSPGEQGLTSEEWYIDYITGYILRKLEIPYFLTKSKIFTLYKVIEDIGHGRDRESYKLMIEYPEQVLRRLDSIYILNHPEESIKYWRGESEWYKKLQSLKTIFPIRE